MRAVEGAGADAGMARQVFFLGATGMVPPGVGALCKLRYIYINTL